MRCPSCSYPDTKVVDSRSAEDGAAIRRRRECLSCGFRFTTYERVGEAPSIVIKRDGSSEGVRSSETLARPSQRMYEAAGISSISLRRS